MHDIRDIEKGSSDPFAFNGGILDVAVPAFTTDPVAGDAIVVFVYSVQNGAYEATHQAPTDSEGHTYTQLGTTEELVEGISHRRLSMWTTMVTTGGSSFVVTGHVESLVQTVFFVVSAWCLSNLDASPYNADVTVLNADTGNGTDDLTLDLVGSQPADSIFVGACIVSGSLEPGVGFNLLAHGFVATGAAGTAEMLSEYQVASGAISFHWTNTAGGAPAYVAMGASWNALPDPLDPPTVTVVTPPTGGTLGGDPVTVTGTGFFAGATVTFDGVDATDVVFINATTLTCVIPAHAEGAVDVVVTNPDDQTGTLADGFTYSEVVSTPVPHAGGEQTAIGPVPSTVTTHATVTRGLNNGTLTYTWTAAVDNPASATISDPDALNTDLTFAAYVPGRYRFVVTATDEGGFFVGRDTLVVMIPPTTAPRLSIGSGALTVGP